MEQEVKAFLNKFIAALRLHGIENIPFAGDEFQQGIAAVENCLERKLDSNEFYKISEAFVKVPVEEIYQQIRNMFMTLNGQGIGFLGVDNPLWTRMTIKMNEYSAKKILDDNSVFGIDADIMSEVTEEFCEAAGVPLWEEF